MTSLCPPAPRAPRPDALYFGCSRCGKCCNSGPALSMAEAVRHSSTFIIGLRYQEQHLNTREIPGQDAALFAEHLKQFSPVSEHNDYPVFINIFPVVAGYSNVKGHSCEALGADLQCQLQADKPSMCRATPLDPMLPAALLGPVALRFEPFGCVRSTPGEHPVEFWKKDAGITDPAFLSGYNDRLQGLIEDAPLVTRLFDAMKQEEPFVPALGALRHASEHAATLETSWVPALLLMALYAPQTIGAVRVLATRQLQMIESAIALALSRKNKIERTRTQNLRIYAEDYRRLILMLDDDFPAHHVGAPDLVSPPLKATLMALTSQEA